jgi:tagatose-1,6-bisphosphate aldolase non-catalytic subunit AgaZ/GatZ
MTRDEARGWFIQMLLEKVREDPYPSTTQLALIEQSIPREMISDYLEVLMEKVAQDTVPSIPMLQRIQRVADSLPRYEQQRE